jgi:hypothetical protein
MNATAKEYMMDNTQALIIGIVGGGIVSWLVTHIYYRKSTHDQNVVFSKLSSDIRDAILANPEEKINSKDLMYLLEKIANGPIDTSRLRGSIDGGHF